MNACAPHIFPAAMPLKLVDCVRLPLGHLYTDFHDAPPPNDVESPTLSRSPSAPERPKLALSTCRVGNLLVKDEPTSPDCTATSTSPRYTPYVVSSPEEAAWPATPPEELAEGETLWELIPYDVPWGEDFMDYTAGVLPGPEGNCLFLRSPTPVEKRRAAQACQMCRERKAKVSSSSLCLMALIAHNAWTSSAPATVRSAHAASRKGTTANMPRNRGALYRIRGRRRRRRRTSTVHIPSGSTVPPGHLPHRRRRRTALRYPIIGPCLLCPLGTWQGCQPEQAASRTGIFRHRHMRPSRCPSRCRPLWSLVSRYKATQ